MSPSPVSLFLLPGNTLTTVGGVMSSLDEYSSDEEDSSQLLAELGVTPPPPFVLRSIQWVAASAL